MSIWSEIKYALNSTLGTKDFKPLDKIINESNYVIGSSELLYDFNESVEYTADTTGGTHHIYFPKSVKTSSWGYFNAVFDISGDFSYSSSTLTLSVIAYKNGAECARLDVSDGDNAVARQNASIRVDFEAGDVISFGLSAKISLPASADRALMIVIHNLKVNGTVKASTFKPVPIEVE